MNRSSIPPHEEEQLVARCLRGEHAAWETMYYLYHHRLVSIISAMLHGERGTEHSEEIAAAVWCSVCSESYSRLRRYDPHAGRLLNFLVNISRREIWNRKRAEKNRHHRECTTARANTTLDETAWMLYIQEFAATLTRREREFFRTDLLKQSTHTVASGVSLANGWQLRSRILKKFRRYFIEDY